ncbi:hypothetical protein QBC45DRAFT_320595, partial [Copromyces sp. CBS 386.78]
LCSTQVQPQRATLLITAVRKLGKTADGPSPKAGVRGPAEKNERRQWELPHDSGNKEKAGAARIHFPHTSRKDR